jgi:hypothetical protein
MIQFLKTVSFAKVQSSSLVRFENKKGSTLKNALAFYNASVVCRRLERF